MWSWYLRRDLVIDEDFDVRKQVLQEREVLVFVPHRLVQARRLVVDRLQELIDALSIGEAQLIELGRAAQ